MAKGAQGEAIRAARGRRVRRADGWFGVDFTDDLGFPSASDQPGSHCYKEVDHEWRDA
jgi:hypothetical protein